MSTLVAVVTGANKGIGFAIVEKLARELKEGWEIFLTARNESLGQAAVSSLADKGLHVHFHQLDITSTPSISTFATYIREKFGGLDILINNAGIAYKGASTAPVAEQAEVTIRTNFTGTLEVCNLLYPLLRPHARVVNVSSMAATMSLKAMSAPCRARFTAPMSMDELRAALDEFIEFARSGSVTESGWPNSCYGMSKVGVTVMTRIQQRQLEQDPRPDLIVNAVCPGYVDTDMTSHKGPLTTEQGADTPVYLALLPPNTQSPKGEHVTRREIVAWK